MADWGGWGGGCRAVAEVTLIAPRMQHKECCTVLPIKPTNRKRRCSLVPARLNSKGYLPSERKAGPGAAIGQDCGALAFPGPAAGPSTWLLPLHCSLLWPASKPLQDMTQKRFWPGVGSFALTCRALLIKGHAEDQGRANPGGPCTAVQRQCQLEDTAG